MRRHHAYHASPHARAPLLGLAVLAALGSGASAAMAEARPCPETSIGSCPNLARCQESCAGLGGDVATARCTNGCCFCPIF